MKMYTPIIPESLSHGSSASLPQLKSLIQVCNGFIQFFCKTEAVLVCGFVIERRMICVNILLNKDYFVCFHPCYNSFHAVQSEEDVASFTLASLK